MMFDWLAFWCGFGAFLALMVLAFFAIMFLLLFILVFRGYFDNREEESEDEDIEPVPGNSRSRIPSQGADVHFPSIPDKKILEVIDIFETCLDGLQSNYVLQRDKKYKALGKMKFGKRDKKITEIVEEINDIAIIVSLLSFIRTHGVDAYLEYLQNNNFFDEDKLRARSVCDPYAPMPEDYPPLEEDKP